MADFRYFAEVDGETVQLSGIWHDGRAGHRRPSAFSGLTPSGARVQCSRFVEYKANPSRHQCDSRCLNATGRVMKCECSCGGKNHGKGHA
jgi:hypothetical protein